MCRSEGLRSQITKALKHVLPNDELWMRTLGHAILLYLFLRRQPRAHGFVRVELFAAIMAANVTVPGPISVSAADPWVVWKHSEWVTIFVSGLNLPYARLCQAQRSTSQQSSKSFVTLLMWLARGSSTWIRLVKSEVLVLACDRTSRFAELTFNFFLRVRGTCRDPCSKLKTL